MLELRFAFIVDNITSMTTIILLTHVIPIAMQRIVVHSTASCYARGLQCTSLCVFASLLCFSVCPCARVVVFYVRVCVSACGRARAHFSRPSISTVLSKSISQFRVFF